MYRRLVDQLRADHGAKPVRLIEPRHIRKLIAEKADTLPRRTIGCESCAA